MNDGPSNNLNLGFWNLMINRDRNAQNLVGLGDCHFWGKGTPINLVQAFNYYQEAKDKNPKYVEVWDRLRLCFLKGLGAPNSQRLAKEAFDKWLELRNASTTRCNLATPSNRQNSPNINNNQTPLTNIPESQIAAAASSSTSQAQSSQHTSQNERKRKSNLQSLMDNLVINPDDDNNAPILSEQTFLPQRNYSMLVERQIEINKKYLAELDEKIKAANEENARLIGELIQRERQNSAPKI